MTRTSYQHHETGHEPHRTWRHLRRPWRHAAAGTLLVMATIAGAPPGSVGAAGCDRLDIPSLSLSKCVVGGGQAQINAGKVVRLTTLSTPVVDWVAAHRTSRGGPFRKLTKLEIGAVVSFHGHDYVVQEYALIDRRDVSPVLHWYATDVPTLVLQTSASGRTLHLWRAIDIAVAEAPAEPAA
jgi:hypothetical protein